MVALSRVLNGISHKNYEKAALAVPETLTLHRLGMFSKLGTSFKTTNCIENVNRQLEIKTGRVSYWQNSDQRRRWVGTALLDIEPRLRTVKGYQHLPELRLAMKALKMKNETKKLQKAA